MNRTQADEDRHVRSADGHDPLTGLITRDALAESFRRVAPQQPHALLLYLRIDDFDQIGRRHGDDARFQVLLEISRRLDTMLRGDDLRCRFGPDEFVTVSFAAWSDDAAVETAMRIAREVARPITIEQADGSVETLAVGVSLGTALGETDDLGVLISHAADNLVEAQRRRAGVHPHA